MKFSTKVFIAVFVSSIAAGTAVIWGAHKYVSAQTREEFVSRYQVFSKVLGDTLTRLDKNTESLMLNAAQVVAARDAEKGLLSTEELKSMRSDLSVTHIFMLNKGGAFIRSTNEDPSLIPNAYSFCPAYRNMVSGSSNVEGTPIIHPHPEPKPYKFLFVPTRNRDRLVEVGVRVDFVAKTLTEALASDANVISMAVFDPKGTSFGRFTANDYQFTEAKVQLPTSFPSVIDHPDEFHFYTKVESSHTKCCQCEVSKTSNNGEYYYVLESVISKKELNAALAKTTLIFIVFGFVMTIISLILGIFVSRRLVVNIVAAAKRVRKMKEAGTLDSRIDLKGKDEVAFLTDEFDHLLDTLEATQGRVVEAEKVQAKVQLAKQIAHNINSPIVTIEMMMPMISRIPDEFRRVLEKSVSEIKAMAERLKIQADSMTVEPLSQDPELLFLPTFLDDFVLQKQFEFTPRKGLILKYVCHESATQSYIKVNSLELKSILSNLVNNAAESYGQKSGEIRIGLTGDDQFCEISVSDDGAGIPEEYLEKLGSERITFKGGSSRGVGLIHAFKTIESWGGRVTIESVVGLGTTLTIKIERFIANELMDAEEQRHEAVL